MSDRCQMQYVYSKSDNQLVLQYSGQAKLNNLQKVWQRSVTLLKRYQPQQLSIDLDDLEAYDSAFIHLLSKIRSMQRQSNHQFLLKSDNYPVASLLKFYDQSEDIAVEKRIDNAPFFESVGTSFFYFFQNLSLMFAFIGELLWKLVSVRKYFRFFVKELHAAGPNGFLITGLMGFILGVILAFQGVIVLEIFGAQIYVVSMVVIALTRELAPLMTAFVVTGRSVSSFAAEIGSMKVNEEIDALKTMDIDRQSFLIIPKILAVTLMIPLLNLYMLLFGIIGCAVVFLSLGYSLDFFYAQLSESLVTTDLVGGLFKVVVFGLIISTIGCICGLKAKQGATAVGLAATKSVVLSIIMIAITDGIFAVLFYRLGF